MPARYHTAVLNAAANTRRGAKLPTDVDVDAVEEGAGDALLVAGDGPRTTGSFFLRVIGPTARAGIFSISDFACMRMCWVRPCSASTLMAEGRKPNVFLLDAAAGGSIVLLPDTAAR